MEKIIYGNYFHILNRGTNKQNIFLNNNDYEYFFRLMEIFIEPIADIYAYAVMKNHFHLALRIKEENEIGYLNPKFAKSKDLHKKWKTTGDALLFRQEIGTNKGLKKTFKRADRHLEASPKQKLRKPQPEKMLQHFCSTYAKGFNQKYKRTGSVFEHPFKKILVDNKIYLKRLILYLHNNPVKHGFCEHPIEYPWTSYLSLISIKPTKLAREKVIGYFDNKANFKSQHKPEDIFEDIDFLFLE